MKTKYAAGVLSLLLLASVLAINFTIHSVAATTATLSIPSVAKNPSDNGTLFTVPVNISGVSDLFGFDINITWQNSLITLSSFSNASLNTIWPQGFFDVFYQTGPGYVDYAAVPTGGSGFNGNGTLFSLTFEIIDTGNFPLSTPIQFYSVELSDSHANAITPILNNGSYSMSATTPGIYFTLVNPKTAKPWEYGKYFEVQVYATNITSSLTGYDLKVDYSTELVTFVQVQPETYVLGTPTVDTSTAGVVHLTISSGGTFVGNDGLLFTLTFLVQFNQTYTHIWRSNSSNLLTDTILLDTTYGSLSFSSGGTIPIGSVTTTTTTLTITIALIQGDVACKGQVNILDLRDVAYYYGQSTADGSPAALYDIKIDSYNTINIYDLVEVAANFGYYNPDSLPTDP
jgi:hypothetical protein